ncbi:MAG TPA: class I SAM-dependent methyltransferase [Bacteroidales bacterium]|nr:class I SAM-dependent methyltransferase [Bacteroidales bacterium]
MHISEIRDWRDYELVDSGGFSKLERFGEYIVWRPEPQAIWKPALDSSEWERLHHARFAREKPETGSERGNWILKKGSPEQWFIQYSSGELKFRLRVGLTSSGHVGVFPEQSNNWNYIFHHLRQFKVSKPQVLNLFAYTGGATLAALAGGATVVHVDSVRSVLTWSRNNMEASGLEGVRWLAEDALRFTHREVRRGSKYHAIILDPPAYGRGAGGEKWILEDSLGELLDLCQHLLVDQPSMIVLNLYSMGFSSLVAANLVQPIAGNSTTVEYGELTVSDRGGRQLPLGVVARFIRM